MSSKTEKMIEKAERVITVLESIISDLEADDFTFSRTRNHNIQDLNLAKSLIRQNPTNDAELEELFAL